MDAKQNLKLGQYHVYQAYYKYGEINVETYSTEEELRAACEERLEAEDVKRHAELRCEHDEDSPSAKVDTATMSLSDLIAHVVEQTASCEWRWATVTYIRDYARMCFASHGKTVMVEHIRECTHEYVKN